MDLNQGDKIMRERLEDTSLKVQNSPIWGMMRRLPHKDRFLAQAFLTSVGLSAFFAPMVTGVDYAGFLIYSLIILYLFKWAAESIEHHYRTQNKDGFKKAWKSQSVRMIAVEMSLGGMAKLIKLIFALLNYFSVFGYFLVAYGIYSYFSLVRVPHKGPDVDVAKHILNLFFMYRGFVAHIVLIFIAAIFILSMVYFLIYGRKKSNYYQKWRVFVKL
jgi:hypothetical protein